MDRIPTSYLVSYLISCISCAGTSHVTSSTNLLQYYGVGVEDDVWCSREHKYLVCCTRCSNVVHPVGLHLMTYCISCYLVVFMLAGDVHLHAYLYAVQQGVGVLHTLSVLVYLHVLAPCSTTTTSNGSHDVSDGVSDGVTHALYLTSCWSVSYQLLVQSYP